MAFDNFLAEGEANSRAGILLSRMESLENDEDSVRKSQIDPDPVILDREDPFSAILPG